MNGSERTSAIKRRAATVSALAMVAVTTLVVAMVGTSTSVAYAQEDPDGWDTLTGVPLSDLSQNDFVSPSEDPSTDPSSGDTSLAPTEDPSSDDPFAPTDDAPTDDSSGDVYGEEEDPGGLTGMVLDWFKTIMGFVYDSTVGDLIKKVAGALQAGILGLPAPSGEVVGIYEGMVGAMRPVILVGILVTALLMMLRTSNYDVAYAGFSALPKFVGLGIAFAFLPEFMEILSKMTLDVSNAFMPSGDRAALAGVELFKAAVTNVAAGGFLNVVLSLAFTIVGFMVLLVAILKNVLFQLLFIAGPFALASSVIPGVNHLAASWFRGVLACAAIPVLWSLELGIASVIVSSPEVIFGEMVGVLGAWSDGLFTSVGAIVILWVMYKTPFKVLEWAFESYDSSRGAWRGLARGVTVGLAGSGIRSGVKALAGAVGGGAGGAAGAAGAGASASAGTGASAGHRTAIGGGGGSRVALERGKAIRQITGQRTSSSPEGEVGGASSSPLPPPGGPQPGLGGGGQQKALPPASPVIEQKYLKQEGTSPGMGRPVLQRQRSSRSRPERKES